MTRPRKDLETVRDLLAQGLSVAEASRRAGIPRGTVRTWLADGLEARIKAPSKQHSAEEMCPYVRNLSESTYAYLLGLYLGDGHLSKHERDVYKLRIYQDNRYPFLIHQCQIAMHWVVPNVVGLVQKEGCKEIYSFSKHWICLFPQHGAGPKHKRSIILEPWQQWVAFERHPLMLLRGLIHSDGCRALKGSRTGGTSTSGTCSVTGRKTSIGSLRAPATELTSSGAAVISGPLRSQSEAQWRNSTDS